MLLASCASVSPLPPSPSPSLSTVPAAGADLLPPDTAPLPPPLTQGKSRWVPVRWHELPGFADDALHEAWNAWLKSCERPSGPWTALCPQVRQLAIATPAEQRAWMVRTLRPHRVEPLQSGDPGLLTAYYEPVMDASRQPTATQGFEGTK